MAQDYDKIFKQNLEEIIQNLARNILNIDPKLLKEIPDDLQYTIEKEPDFLKKVDEPDIPNYILHLEIQSTDPRTMVFRMLLYYAFLLDVYKLDVKQIVLYIGNKDTPNMPSSLERLNLSFSFELINIVDLDHEKFLSSDKPEDVVIAILCDFKQKTPETIIKEILLRLKKLAKNALELGKYLTQLEVLSKLRKLQKQTVKIINKMPIEYDLKTDERYLQGQGVGIEKGMEKGIAKGIAKGIEKGMEKGIEVGEIQQATKSVKAVYAKLPHLSNQEIAELLQVSRELVDRIIKRG